MSFWNDPDRAMEAENDRFAAELLNQDVEKRRRNAWLRKLGFVTRLFVYACLFGALYIFIPKGMSEGWLTTRPFAELTLGDIGGPILWVGAGILLIRALFNPNPRPDFREAWGYFGLLLIAVFGGLYFYFHA